MSTAIDVGRGNFEEVVLLGSTGHPVLVDFWAPWCAPCRMLAPVLDRFAAEYEGRMTLAKLNTDEEPELATQYGVRGIPNCKLFVDGRVVDEFTGVLPEPEIREFLANAVPSPATLYERIDFTSLNPTGVGDHTSGSVPGWINPAMK